MDANTIIQIISSFGFSDCDVWGFVLVYGETKAGAPRRNGTPKRYDCGKYESVSRINNAY